MRTTEKITNFAEMNSDPLILSTDSVVLCYGHFNVIHPGHIRFLQHAKSLGQTLIVSVVGDSLLAENERKHFFKEKERAEGVASLYFVDRVLLFNEVSLSELIFLLKPNILVLGKEFEINRPLNIEQAIISLNQAGGKVIFHAGEVSYSNSEILHNDPKRIALEKRELFLHTLEKENITVGNLIQSIEKFNDSKLLVIGDTIVDQYVLCDAVGMSAEAPVLVVKELESKEFIGGAAIVAAHVKALGAHPIFLSVVGTDANASLVENELKNQGVESILIPDSTRPTTFKIRYMVESQKLFRVSRLKEHNISKEIEDLIIEKVNALVPNINGILFSDFVYGVITERVIKEITKIAKLNGLPLFGDLQCSSQVGKVSRFNSFDLICPTEREARIDLGNNQDGVEWIANQLIEKTKSKNLLIKLGANGFIAYYTKFDKEKTYTAKEHFPALVSNPIDVAGAGDSLLAAMAVSLSSGSSILEAAAIGACMAAVCVQTVGNVPIPSTRLVSFLKDFELESRHTN